MALVETWLFGRLTGHAGLSALIGTRCFPQVIPEQLAPGSPMSYPAVRYLRVSTPEVALTHDAGPAGLARPRFQVDVYGATAASARAAAEQVRLALEGYRDQGADPRIDAVILADRQAVREADSDLYREILDFFIWHAEAVA